MDEFESSEVPEEAAPSELPSLPSRLFNVFLSPGKVMEALSKNPAWVGALLVGVLLVALQTLLIPFDMILEAQRQAMLERGQDPGDIPEAFMNVMRYATPVFGMIGIALFTFLSAGLYWLIFSFVLGDEGRYRQYLAVGTHALFVPALLGLALVPLKIMTGDAQATLNLGLFVPFLADGYLSNVFRLLDLTGIWSALIIAQGAHSIDTERGFGSAAAVTLSVTLVIALIFATFV